MEQYARCHDGKYVLQPKARVAGTLCTRAKLEIPIRKFHCIVER